MNFKDCTRALRARDQLRNSLPGEHALVAVAGGALVVSALFAPSPMRATLRAVLGAALLLRAASGRDGVQAAQGEPAQSARGPWRFPTSAQHGSPQG